MVFRNFIEKSELSDLEKLIYLIEREFCQYGQTEYICQRRVYADELRRAIKLRIAQVREIVKLREEQND